MSSYFSHFSALFSRVESIKDSTVTPETWEAVQPCMKFPMGRYTLIINQPMSSFWVYALGILTCYVAYDFWTLSGQHVALRWWAVSLWFWGVGALFAGTSFQAFGYVLKCEGRQRCVWTNWWEVVYLAFQQVSVNVMLVAVALTSFSPEVQDLIIWGSVICSALYCGTVVVGAFVPRQSLITFERMCLWCLPVYLLLLAVNGAAYAESGHPLDGVYAIVWLGLFATMALYWGYSVSNLTQKLWRFGYWFSDNDVLHVLLIAWVLYIWNYVGYYLSQI